VESATEQGRSILPRDSRTARERSEQEIALYDAIARAVANLHAALAQVDAAWVLISAERPDPSVGAFAALDAAEQILTVAREDLARARTALSDYTQDRTKQ
jgi:hypothetical protein